MDNDDGPGPQLRARLGYLLKHAFFELEELRASEIAAELGVAEAAVVSRLQRARSVMRRICERRDRAAASSSAVSDQESQP